MTKGNVDDRIPVPCLTKDLMGFIYADKGYIKQNLFVNLYERGLAKSIEIWLNNELVGGLYGVEAHNIFCGESMFSKVSNASKLAFIHLVKSNNYELIDCQVYNAHLASLGAREIDRKTFLSILKS